MQQQDTALLRLRLSISINPYPSWDLKRGQTDNGSFIHFATITCPSHNTMPSYDPLSWRVAWFILTILCKFHPRTTFVTGLSSSPPLRLHTVAGGVVCRQVHIALPLTTQNDNINDHDNLEVVILEATADSQETLVNSALQEDDYDPTTLQLAHSDPYGAVLWPAATAVARTILHNPSQWLTDKVVCEWGAGTGLVSLAATATALPQRVMATDYEPLPLQLVQYAHEHCNNNASSGKVVPLETALWDVLDYDTTPLPTADVYVVADIMYEARTGRALAHRVVQALQAGARVLIGDSPGRAGRPAFETELQALGIRGHPQFVPVPGWTVTGDRHDLICSPTSPTISGTTAADGKATTTTPQPLTVALMELDPVLHCPTT